MEPVDLMSTAYRSRERSIMFHDGKYQELERRHREVKRDYDALQKALPIEAETIEG